MNSALKINPEHNLFIVDDDYYYALTIKYSLNKKFGQNVHVNVFLNAEASLEAMKKFGNKPHVLLMDHTQNKEMIKENGEYAVNVIKRISPDTRIVILSDEKCKKDAEKALAHGAQGFVIKDQFALEHIYIAVENCLHPAKI